jgi:hypothetical protein
MKTEKGKTVHRTVRMLKAERKEDKRDDAACNLKREKKSHHKSKNRESFNKSCLASEDQVTKSDRRRRGEKHTKNKRKSGCALRTHARRANDLDQNEVKTEIRMNRVHRPKRTGLPTDEKLLHSILKGQVQYPEIPQDMTNKACFVGLNIKS